MTVTVRYPVQVLTAFSPVLRVWGKACRRTTLLSTSNGFFPKQKDFESVRLYGTTLSTIGFSNSCHCQSCRRYPYWSSFAEPVRFYSAQPKPASDKGLQKAADGDSGITLSTAEKVKENVKTVSYGGVIIVGVVIGGAMLYFVLNELFSSESPNNIYTHAFKMCKLSTEVQDALGTPIKCYGEESRRGWRRHVAYQEFLHGDNIKSLRMRFYIEGPFKKGTVNLEKKTNEKGKYVYTYILVEVDGTYPPRTISVPF